MIDFKLKVPPTPGGTPALSLLPGPHGEDHTVRVELSNGVCLTLDGRADDLFNLFAQGYDMLGAFLFGSVSRDFPRKSPDQEVE